MAVDLQIPSDAPVLGAGDHLLSPREDGGPLIVMTNAPKRGFFGSGCRLEVGIKSDRKTCIGVWGPNPSKLGPPNPDGFASPALGRGTALQHSNGRNVRRGRWALLIREDDGAGGLSNITAPVSLRIKHDSWRTGINLFGVAGGGPDVDGNQVGGVITKLKIAALLARLIFRRRGEPGE